MYGELIPLDSSAVVDWCISRIETWGKAANMEIFKEEEKDGRLTLVLGGRVLVIDVELATRRTSSDPMMRVSSVKTSHALPHGTSGNALAERSGSLDAFLRDSWNAYFETVQRDSPDNSMKAAQIAKDINAHFAYLMKLDGLASQEGDDGIRWFNDIGLMCGIAERVLEVETASIAKRVILRPEYVQLLTSCLGHWITVPFPLTFSYRVHTRSHFPTSTLLQRPSWSTCHPKHTIQLFSRLRRTLSAPVMIYGNWMYRFPHCARVFLVGTQGQEGQPSLLSSSPLAPTTF